MKKIISVMALVLTVLAACKEKTPDTVFTPGISFLDSHYEIPKGGDRTLTVSVDVPFDTETRLPIEITGGEAGVDYTLDGPEEVVIAPGARNAELRIAVPAAITQSKTLTVRLTGIPEGYDGGRFPSVTITTTTEPIASFSFMQSRVEMYGATRAVGVRLYDMSGLSIRQNQDVRIKIVADPSSTAVYGTHWKFKNDDDRALIEAGEQEGYITIESLLYEEGHDRIILTNGEPNNYYNGNIPFVTVTLPRSIEEGLIGSWKGLRWTSDVNEYEMSWGITPEEVAQMAASISENDIITFDSDNTLTVDMPGPLGRFFRDCDWTINGTQSIFIGSEGIRPIYVDAPVCELSVINYSFSDTEPQLQPGIMMLYMTYDPQYGDMLNMYVDYDMFNYENSPIPFLWGYEPLKYTFIRVAE